MTGDHLRGASWTGGSRWAWGLAAALAIAVLLAPDLGRTGYSPDEEFTVFAVRGIEAHGLPLLPSGLLYDRGLGYSYGSWLAGLVAGQSLATFRAVSLVTAALALAVLFVELRRLTATGAAALGVVLSAASLPFWVSATTARFYAPFLLCYLLALGMLARPGVSCGLTALALAAAGARWTHELAFTLAAAPLAGVLLAGRPARRVWTWRLLAVLGGLAAAQAVIIGVHALAPPSNGDVMMRRFFLWQVLNLFERPPLDLAQTLPVAVLTGTVAAVVLGALRWQADRASAALMLLGGFAAAVGQLAIAPAAALALLPVVQRQARLRLMATGLGVAALSGAFWVVSLGVAGLPPADAAARVAARGFVYPLDMFAHLVTESPVLVAATLVLLVLRAAGRAGTWTVHERSLHGLWIGWVLWFGVIDSGITVRYLLLPVTFMLCAISVDLHAALARMHGAPRMAAAAAGVLLAVSVTAESWGALAAPSSRAAAARPTMSAGALGEELLADDLVACTDELACVLVAGRADAWLALDGFFRERFVVARNGEPTGTYTGAPAAFTLMPLVERATRENRRLVVLETLRDVPGYGSTATLVTRQLAREDLRGVVLAELDGARLVHVVRPAEGAVARARG